MKTERVFLAEWAVSSFDEDNHDIPWPMVHEWAGHDVIRWLNSQNLHRCQLVLDKLPAVGMRKLYAEFYDPRLRTEFALRFAK